MKYFHGGFAGLSPGQTVQAAPAHVDDSCYLCVARRAGRSVTIGEWRGYLGTRAARGDAGAARILSMLEEQGAPDDVVLDPPSARQAVYVTTSLLYATWYAARSRGDLYEVEPTGELTVSPEDHFPSWTCESGAVVVRVLRRGVRLDRSERREIMRQWKRADKLAELATGG